MNKSLKMNAEIEFKFSQPISVQTDLGLDIGTIEFVVNEKFVPIEFDQIDSESEFLDENTVRVKLEAGYAANAYKDAFRGELAVAYKEAGLSPDDITAKFISKATQINVFDIWPLIGGEEADADTFNMTINKIVFSDNHGAHSIVQEPITTFNAAFNLD